MSAPAFKTRAEQHVEWLEAERCARPLTNDEWQSLARAEHAIYCRIRRLERVEQEANAAALAEYGRADEATLKRMFREAGR